MEAKNWVKGEEGRRRLGEKALAPVVGWKEQAWGFRGEDEGAERELGGQL